MDRILFPDGAVIYVRRQPSDWRIATYRAENVSSFRWDTESGGVNRAFSHPAVCANVMCNQMINRELAHSCIHGPAPHNIKVVLVKKDNLEVWPMIEAAIGPRPGTKKRALWEQRNHCRAPI